MKSDLALSLRSVLALCVLIHVTPVQAQQHRATRLGDPAHRFAPPLTRPEELRTLLLDDKLQPDIASILNQAGWKGNLDDLRRAAASAEITELKLPTGTRMPFMSSREKGKPVALIDVLWAGKQPIEAYSFLFTSNGQRYRLVTPKPCSNFFVESLGPDRPRISIHFEVVDLEDPIAVGGQVTYEIKVANQSATPITNIRLTCAVPLNQMFVSGAGPTQVTARDQSVTIQPLPVLDGKGVVFWRVVVKAVRAGDTRFKVDLACDQLAQPIAREEATQQY